MLILCTYMHTYAFTFLRFNVTFAFLLIEYNLIKYEICEIVMSTDGGIVEILPQLYQLL